MSGANVEVADVFRQYGDAYRMKYGLAPHQHRAVWSILHCRTAALGGHVEGCTECGHVRVRYNSCGNRHCPKCQWQRQQEWLSKRLEEVLPVPYYHLVFTLPQQLNCLTPANERLVYNLLLRCAWAALREVCAQPRYLGARAGMLAVLHTWGQNLSLHPHVHAIVPAGGLSVDESRWVAPRRGSFFVPVRVLSALFRGKFMAGLRSAYGTRQLRFSEPTAHLGVASAFHAFCRPLYDQSWVVYAKRPFGGPAQVLRYLGRYTHRVAISNARVEAISENGVTFRYKDYRHDSQVKQMTLTGLEFIRRFLQHVLPPGFTKIRYYGILANRGRQSRLQHCRELIRRAGLSREAEPKEELPTQPNPRQCPQCGHLSMVYIFALPGGCERAPPLVVRIPSGHPS